MGASVTRLDYDWADDFHTHSRRRAAILRKYPEIRKLMVYDPVFKWKVSAMVATQVISFYLLSYVHSFWVLFLVAYFFGGVINHSLTLAIHDISHNQAWSDDAYFQISNFFSHVDLSLSISFLILRLSDTADHWPIVCLALLVA